VIGELMVMVMVAVMAVHKFAPHTPI